MGLNGFLESKFPLCSNGKVRDNLFLFALALIVFDDFWAMTMFPPLEILWTINKTVALILIVLKFIIYDRWRVRDVAVAFVFFSIGLLVKFKMGENNAFMFVLLVCGARDVDSEKILKVHFFEVLLLLAVTVVSSLTGLIENLVYGAGTEKVRNSFGICFATDFAAVVFFLAAEGYYIYRKRLKWWMYLPGIILSWVVYRYCHTRLDCISLVVISVLYALVSLLEKKLEGKAERVRIILSFSILFFFVLCFLVTYYYDPALEWMERVNNIFSSRLSLGREGFTRYSVTLFGTYFEQEGAGGSLVHYNAYFFIDSSYILLLLRYGAVFTLLVLSSYCALTYRRRDDLFFLALSFVIALNATTAHHLIHFQYNPLFMLLFALTKEDIKDKQFS